MMNFNIKTFLFLTSVAFSMQGRAALKNLSDVVRDAPGIAGEKNIVIAELDTVTINSALIDIGTLTINGKLQCGSIALAEIRAKTIYVNGIFECGNKVAFNKKLTISLKHDSSITFDENNRTSDSDISKFSNSKYRGIIVHDRGTLRLIGADGSTRTGIRRLLSKAAKNATVLNLTNGAPRGWSIGDEIVVAPTAYDSKEAETFKIQNFVNGKKDITGALSSFTGKSRVWGLQADGKYGFIYSSVSNGSKFIYDHFGASSLETHTVTKASPSVTLTLDQRAEVANLTRNIKIQAYEDPFLSESSLRSGQIGGHVMVEAGGKAFIDGVEFFKMGQAGVMARYPFHWHNVGDATGQYIKNSSIHHSFQRCVTVHGTKYASVQNNVCYDFKGHGFFLEDGNETGNKITGNLAVGADFPSIGKYLLASDNPAFSVPRRFPAVSSFWISNPNNTVTDNIAAGSVGSGFWMAFQQSAPSIGGQSVPSPLRTNTPVDAYARNIAHSSLVGHTWDGGPSTLLSGDKINPNNLNDKNIESAHYSPSVIPVFKNLIAYKNTQAGVYFRGQTAVYDKAVVADSGWAFFLAYNQIVKNSVMIGQTASTGNYVSPPSFGKLGGITLYDGPFELENVDFINYFTVTKGGVPFLTIGGTNKYTNRAKGLTFRSIGTAPPATTGDPSYRLYADRFEAGTSSANALGWVEDHMASKIRDLDGSLMGTGVNNKLLMPDSDYGSDKSCSSDATKLYGFKLCSESTKTFTLSFSSSTTSANIPNNNRFPFVVRRVDISNPANPDAYSLPYSDWGMLNRIKDLTLIPGPIHNKETMILPVGSNYMYEFLFMNEIKSSTGNEEIKSLKLTMNAEKAGELSPVIKISGLGSSCSLSPGVRLASYNDLLTTTNNSSYYSNGNDLYIRLKATADYITLIKNDSNSGATAESITEVHGLKCTTSESTHDIVGKIDNITTAGVVTGSACKYGTKNSSDNTFKIYLGSDAGRTEITGASLSFDSSSSDDASIGFNCGDLSQGSGHRFTFTIPSNILIDHPGEPLSFSSNGINFLKFSGQLAKVPGVLINYKGNVDTKNDGSITVDGKVVSYLNSKTIAGWACNRGSDEQLKVSVTIGSSTGTITANMPTSGADETAIAGACQNSKGIGHRFVYTIPQATIDSNKGKSVEIKISSQYSTRTMSLTNSLKMKP